MDIPDEDTLTEYTYLGCETLLDLTVNLDITHPWRGDLLVTLQNPDGTTVVLHDRTGSSADNLVGTYNLDGTGSLTSVDSLSAFEGGYALGYWTLSVSDTAEYDTGTLNNFSLTATCY
jgi:subtilisin-like proprotein convertase family protein